MKNVLRCTALALIFLLSAAPVCCMERDQETLEQLRKRAKKHIDTVLGKSKEMEGSETDFTGIDVYHTQEVQGSVFEGMEPEEDPDLTELLHEVGFLPGDKEEN